MVAQRFLGRLNRGLQRLNVGLVVALALSVAIWMVLVGLIEGYLL